MKHPLRRRACGLVLAGFVAACGSDNNNNNNNNNNNSNVVNVDPSMSESAIASAFSAAAADSTISMAAGTYHFTNSLNLSTKNNITVKGAGMTTTILDFSGQTATSGAGADGLVQAVGAGQTVKSSFHDFSIRDTAGDGLKITGGNGVHVNNVAVSWPTRAADKHGGYGIYPVQCKNVLIEGSSADGASDTGIYVGQSDTVVVRNNVVTNNVSGIEIENTFNADVTGNDSHGNTVGFLVFDLPNLQQVGGHHIRVYSNQFHDNNHYNFGDPAGTVALVPGGTGGAVMANTDVEIFGNTFTGNKAVGFASISCFAAFGADPTSPCLHGTSGYNPFPKNVNVHDNTFTDNGADPLGPNAANPDPTHPSLQLAGLLASGFPPNPGDPGWHNGHVSNVAFDGIIGLGSGPTPICAKNNGTETFNFGNMHLDQFDPQAPNLNAILEFDQAEFACTLTPLTPVPVPTF